MSVRRFFLRRESIDGSSRLVSVHDPKLVKRIQTVLRLRRGDNIDILDGEGNIYHCVIANIEKGLLQARIEEHKKVSDGPACAIRVALPLIKAARFEWALEKLTELGVDSIVPLILERSVIRSQDRKERWDAIVCEAAQQCERGTIPKLVTPKTLHDLIESHEFNLGTAKFLCAERLQGPLLKDALGNPPLNAVYSNHQSKVPIRSIWIIVGPEGGFTRCELELASSRGIHLVSLGERILRSETAAIYATSLVVAWLDDYLNKMLLEA